MYRRLLFILWSFHWYSTVSDRMRILLHLRNIVGAEIVAEIIGSNWYTVGWRKGEKIPVELSWAPILSLRVNLSDICDLRLNTEFIDLTLWISISHSWTDFLSEFNLISCGDLPPNSKILRKFPSTNSLKKIS